MIKGLGHIRGIAHRSDPSFFAPQRRRDRKPQQKGQATAPVYTRAETPKLSAPLTSALKYAINRPGFGKRFDRMLAPMRMATSVDEMRSFFITLPKVVALARTCPRKARAILKRSTKTPKALYASLVALASDDDSAHASALKAINNLGGNYQLALECIGRTVKFNTRGSRRLIEALFDHSKKLSPMTRVKLFKQLAMSKGLAYKATLVECFGKIMKNSTARDRNRMYSALLSWTEKWRPINNSLRANLAIVQECLRGQLSSCPIVARGVHSRAQRVLGLSPSARG